MRDYQSALLWNWCKYLYNCPIVRICLEAAVMYLRFKVARPPWRAVAWLTRLRQISRVELLGQPMRRDTERLDRR